MDISQTSSPEAKIAVFRSLFRGREEVYARRFESKKSGKSGYQPACGNEWVRGICEKPQIKCSDCPHQQWLPVTEEVVKWHLSGVDYRGQVFVMGVYPMLLDETCWFLAVDFDGEHWREDALAYLETCDHLGIPAVLERSRSGDGGHVWVFFSEAIPASLARKLGAHTLTETMERRPEVGFGSYDRFFPNQDTLPKGGFGNLIALPLQKEAREKGNSIFLDENFEPYADQWALLGGVERMKRHRVEEIVSSAEGRGRIVWVRMALPADEDDDQPWELTPSRTRDLLPSGPMPMALEIVQGDQIYVSKADLTPPLRNALLRLAAFQNPEFYKAQAMRLPTYDKPRIIACAEDHTHHLALPRGCLDDLLKLFRTLKIQTSVRDERFSGNPIPVSFQGTLRPDQEKAALAMLGHETGVLSATTAFGKTVLAAWLIAQRGVNTLIIVHRQQLMEQWVERLSQFLGVPTKEIGRWGGGRKKLTGKVDVAIMQSLVRKGVVLDLVGDYGHIVADECHHLSAHSFELVARRAKAKFVTGLSATVARKDGHHPIIFMQCGPVRYRVDARQQAAERPFTHEVLVRPTGFFSPDDPQEDKRMEFQRLCDGLIKSASRNRMIVEEVLQAIKNDRSPIVLTERTEHLEALAESLLTEVPHLITLRGGMGRKALRSALDQLKNIPEGEGRVVIATGRFIGEGFDDSRLDTLFLTMPVSWSGTIAQYVGRLHRLHDGKRAVQVYDYADLDVPMLSRMFDRRCAGYEAVGYTVLFPAVALPGWPEEVPLPLDPQWRRDFSASAQRLIRDGVDRPLASLFVDASRFRHTAPERADQFHRASGEFLFRRFETLPNLAGRFRQRAALSIPCDYRSEMEVDLLCEDAQLVIELDQPGDLGDADVWRRDRRKDALLQDRGFLVLHFLTTDLSERLEMVLDTVLRMLENRKKQLQIGFEFKPLSAQVDSDSQIRLL